MHYKREYFKSIEQTRGVSPITGPCNAWKISSIRDIQTRKRIKWKVITPLVLVYAKLVPLKVMLFVLWSSTSHAWWEKVKSRDITHEIFIVFFSHRTSVSDCLKITKRSNTMYVRIYVDYDKGCTIYWWRVLQWDDLSERVVKEFDVSRWVSQSRRTTEVQASIEEL